MTARYAPPLCASEHNTSGFPGIGLLASSGSCTACVHHDELRPRFHSGTTLEKCAGITAALAFAKGNFRPFQEEFFAEIKRLMGCLVYAGKPLDATPYRDLASDKLLQEVAAEFIKAACGTLGQVGALPPVMCRHDSPECCRPSTTLPPTLSLSRCVLSRPLTQA